MQHAVLPGMGRHHDLNHVLHERCRDLAHVFFIVALTVASGLSVAAPETTPDGYKVGDFRILPEASVTQSWDDNVYGTATDPLNDVFTTFAATVKVDSVWSKHRLGAEAGASANRYAEYASEDVVDWGVGADGRLDLSAKSHLLGGLRYEMNHEDRSAPDAAVADTANANEPTRYGTMRLHLGFAHRLAPFTARLGGVLERLDYQDVISTGGMLDNDYRDRDQYSLGARFSLQTSAQREIFLQAATDTRRYLKTASSGKDSDGYRLALGMRFDHGPMFQGDGFLGYLSQDYNDVALKDVNALHFGGNLKWQPAPGRLLTAYLDRSVNETTLSGASSHLDSTLGLRIEHAVNERLTLNASASYNRSEYQGHALKYDQWQAGLGIRYELSRLFYVAVGYQHTDRNANLAEYDYTKNLIFITFGYVPKGR